MSTVSERLIEAADLIENESQGGDPLAQDIYAVVAELAAARDEADAWEVQSAQNLLRSEELEAELGECQTTGLRLAARVHDTDHLLDEAIGLLAVHDCKNGRRILDQYLARPEIVKRVKATA